MSAEVDITIVGAGVIGCAVARELAQAGREIFVLEKNSGITRGENQSSRNSGVIHAGLYYDRSMRPLKAGLCAEGNTPALPFLRAVRRPLPPNRKTGGGRQRMRKRPFLKLIVSGPPKMASPCNG